MEKKFTPGPWMACEDWDKECITVYADYGIQPHICYSPEYGTENPIANANMTLIAASPILLEALEAFVKSCYTGCSKTELEALRIAGEQAIKSATS